MPAPVAGAGQVVVDVERVGVCGTDVEFFTGEMSLPAHGARAVPAAARARVVRHGRGGRRRRRPGWLGRRVTGDTMLGCGHVPPLPRRAPARLRGPARGRHPRRLPGRARRAAGRAGDVAARAARRGRRDAAARWSSRAATRCARCGAPRLPPGDRVLVLGPGHDRAAGGDVRRGRRAPRCTCRDGRRGRSSFARHARLRRRLDRRRRCPTLPVGRGDRRLERGRRCPARALDLVEPGGRVVYIGLSPAARA